MKKKLINDYYKKLKHLVKSKLAYKIIFHFSLMVLILIIILTNISYYTIKNIQLKNYIENTTNIFQFVGKNLEEYLNEIENLSLSFIKDDKLMNILRNDVNDYSEQIYVENQVKNLFYFRAIQRDIDMIQVYTPSNKRVYSISKSQPNISTSYSENIENETRYVESKNSKYHKYINKQENNPNNFLDFNRSLIEISNQKIIALISISVNNRKIENMVKDIITSKDDILIIMDKENRIFYKNNPLDEQFIESLNKKTKDIINGGNITFRYNSKEYMVICNPFSKNQWNIVKIVPIENLKMIATKTRNLFVLLAVLFEIFFVIVIVLLSNKVTNPMKLLGRNMSKMKQGTFEIINTETSEDEIGKLLNKYNEMALFIDSLINEKYKMKLNEKSARLKALEAQINPHFLYNSLQVISTKALMAQNVEIYEMVQALGKTFRYLIKARDKLTVKEEIDFIEQYLLLEKSRFGKRLNVVLQIEKECEDYIIPKLIFQILIENSIKHSLSKSNEVLTIRIKAYVKDNKLNIIVDDDGLGIGKERLEYIRKYLIKDNSLEENLEHIGFSNIYSRLSIMYGDRFSFNITSKLGRGTKIEIVLIID